MSTAAAMTSRTLRILHLEDNARDQELVRENIEAEGYAARWVCVEDRQQFLDALERGGFDLILSDQSLPTFDGVTALKLARERYPDIPFVFVTGSMGEEAAIDKIKEGATDYVLKDRLNRLAPAIERAMREREQARQKQHAVEALRLSEERFQLAAQASHDAIWDWNLDTGALWRSSGFQHFGYAPEAMAPNFDCWESRLHPDDSARVRSSVRQALAAGESSWSAEYSFQCADGAWALVFDRARIVRDENGRPIRMVGAMMDVTERKKVQRLIQERSSLAALEQEAAAAFGRCATVKETLDKCLQMTLATLDVCLTRIWLHDEAGKSLTPQAAAGFCVQEQGMGQPIALGAGLVGRVAATRASLATNQLAGDPSLSTADRGNPRSIEAMAASPLLAGQQLLGVVAVYSWKPLEPFAEGALGVMARELSFALERRRAEEKIREQAALLDQAQDAILVRGLDNRIRYWNRSAERLYGWTALEALHQDATLLLSETQGRETLTLMQVMLDQGEWSGEINQRTKDGRDVTVKSLWSLVRDEANQPACFLVVNTDITGQRELESQFLRAQRLENIGVLASGIAHDLNNVLAPITMGISVLRDHPQDPLCREILESLETSSARGAAMVRQILTFARGASGEQIVLQPNHIIKEVLRIARDTFPKSIRLDHSLPTDLPTVKGDPTQIQQVLLNLLVNARDAMPDGGVLRVATTNIHLAQPPERAGLKGQPGSYVRIEVEDTGIGMTQDLQRRAFEPFFTTKAPGKGTGLGLSTTVNILQAHGGLIDLESTPGKGTRFSVYFPAIHDPARKIETSARPDVPGGRHKLILLVDDESAIRAMSRMILESCDYRVLTAEDGAQALLVFKQYKDDIDLVFTDVVMPVMDGLAAIRALRALAPCVKILATSGLSEAEEVILAVQAEADAFLPKPYSPDELLNALAALVKPPAG